MFHFSIKHLIETFFASTNIWHVMLEKDIEMHLGLNVQCLLLKGVPMLN